MGDDLDGGARQEAQKRTFTRWCNHFLSERVLKIDDLYTDLADGILLINLLELISAKSLGKFDKKPRIDLHKIQNLNIALGFIKSEGLKLVNIGADDLLKGTPKLVLGLIWTLILRYQIQFGGGDAGSPKKALLDWVNKQIKPYGMQANDFTDSFKDGKVLNALADSLRPGIIDMKKLSDVPAKDAEQAFSKAEEHFQIPRLIDVEDLVRNPDEHSVMTYVSYFRDYLENKAKQDELLALRGPNAAKCYAEGKGVDGKPVAFTGRPLEFTIHSLNKDGEPVTAQKFKRDFVVKATGPSGEVPVKLVDNNDGTYTGSYVADAPGKYDVDIALVNVGGAGATPISGSTYHLGIKDGGDASNSWAEGQGLTRAYDDRPAFFTVHVLDKHGAPVVGEDTLAVGITLKAKGPSRPAPPPPSAAHAQQEVMAPPKNCEECGTALTGTKFCTSCGWKVILRPRRDSTLAKTAQAISHPKGESEHVPVQITDNKDGTYEVKYRATIPGEYLVLVTLDQKAIRDMPSHLTVVKGIDAGATTAHGRGVESPGFADRPHPFVIQTRDRDGKNIPHGGETFKVVVKGPHGPIPCEVVDNHDGTYSGSYTPTAIGDHVVDIKLDHAGVLEGIKDNPFKIAVKQGADPSKSYAEGEGTQYAMDNRPAYFTVHAIDPNGKPVTGEWVDVKILDPAGDGSKSAFPVQIKDNNDGTYSVKYDADKPGVYSLDVRIGEQPIRDMPHDITVHPGVDPAKTTVDGPGVEQGFVGRPLPFIIHAKDKQGKAVPVGGDTFKANVVGPNGAVPCDIQDNGDGTYTGTYVPTVPGPHKVHLKVNNDPTPVGKSPYTANVLSGADPKQSYAKGKGWKYAYDNVPTSFVVHVNDANGKPVAGEHVKVVFVEKSSEEDKGALSKLISLVDEYMLKKKADQNKSFLEQRNQERKAQGLPPIDPSSSDVPVDITDNHDGTYLVEYTAVIPGKYEVHVTVGPSGLHIRDSPKVIPVHWSCPNAPCAHTQKELHAEVRTLREENERLKAELAKLKGQRYDPVLEE